MKVIVLGAGVVGIATAYYLARDGHQVSLVDRNQGAALEASYANGGQLSYSYVAPLADPAVWPKLVPWLLSPSSPVRFRPQLDARQWRWCLQFLAACRSLRSAETTRHLLRLGHASRRLMHELLADDPALDFAHANSGKLVVYRDAAALESARRQVDFQQRLVRDDDYRQEVLDRAACMAIEPALDGLRGEIVGGVHTASEDTADCYRFSGELLDRILAASPENRCFFATSINGLSVRQGEVVGVETSAGRLEADAYVLAAGCDSERLARRAGLSLPIYPLKGYSLTAPISDPEAAPTLSVTDFQRKIVYARLAGRLRVAGIADIGGYDGSIAPRRLATLLGEARGAFPGAADYEQAEAWAGLRPATPSGRPILGRSSCRKLWLNVGHGALGFTLALASGRVLADLIAGQPPFVALDGFTLPGRESSARNA
ncbi:MAG: D-amino acid dehydrogenase [Candidatus Accumulibacter sp.]|uniref:D-amino acid dehydrogenase n=1 Tax=Accumulibacter sp. TaxID=2053492 RepID=UPI001A3F9067|nr:D-amino acid dehydrogenase [Accumulibacter sp.]MBL8368157.1 D-amino acid dehydrogenase [Accumulibacter sp.]